MSKLFITQSHAIPRDKHRYTVKDICVIIFAWLVAAALVYLTYLKVKVLFH